MSEIDKLGTKIAEGLKKSAIINNTKVKEEIIEKSGFRVVDGMLEVSWLLGAVTYHPLLEFLKHADNVKKSIKDDIKLYLKLAGKPNQYYMELFLKGRHDPSFRIL